MNTTEPTAAAAPPRSADQAEQAAAYAYRNAYASAAPHVVEGIWRFYQDQAIPRDDMEGRLARADAAAAAMNGFANLAPQHRAAVLDTQGVHAGRVVPSAALRERLAAAYRSEPGLAAYQEAREAHDASVADRNAAIQVAQREATDRAAPALIVGHLRAAGINPTADDDGNLTVPAGTVMPAADREVVVRYKSAIVGFLRAEAAAAAEAARPLVIA